jgi:AcrR family transcriptional regulator
LAKEGAQRFTTARVAEKAGVSVGSLYQYFPNKAAILFRLQSDEWRQTTDLLRAILEDTAAPPLERLRTLVHAFIRSECEEAEMRVALSDAAPLYRDAPEAQDAKAAGAASSRASCARRCPRPRSALAGARPGRRPDQDDAQPGGQVRSRRRRERRPRSRPTADAMADMFLALLVTALGTSGRMEKWLFRVGLCGALFCLLVEGARQLMGLAVYAPPH